MNNDFQERNQSGGTNDQAESPPQVSVQVLFQTNEGSTASQSSSDYLLLYFHLWNLSVSY